MHGFPQTEIHVSMLFSLIDTKRQHHIELEKKDSLVSTEYLIRPATSDHKPQKKINAYSKRSRENSSTNGICLRNKFTKFRTKEKDVRTLHFKHFKVLYRTP